MKPLNLNQFDEPVLSYIENLQNDIMKNLGRMFKWNCNDVFVMILDLIWFDEIKN